MAYTNPKYKITAASQSGGIYYVYLIQNDSYAGSPIEYPATDINIEYIPQSDDVFESILVSQLSISIDVTDNLNNMPNFVTLDDRKYLVKVYYGETLQWQGWALSDNVNVSYSTGRKELSFNAIDGLGMLEKIQFPLASDYTLTDLKTCLYYIITCLNQIQFPTSLNVVSGISYYSDTMLDRTDGTQYEPLNQSYLRVTTFINNSLEATNCLDVLREICKGYGAKIYQAEMKWFIITPNQFAQNSYYYTEYNSSSTVVTSGTRSKIGNIQGYLGNTSGLYYVDNSQTKLLKKGYNKVLFTKDIDYPSNYITNADLQIYTGNDAFGWIENVTGTGAYVKVKVYEETGFNSFILFSGNSGTASVIPEALPSINFNDVGTLSLDISNIVTNSAETKICIINIALTDGVDSYYLDVNKTWQSSGTNYYFIEYSGGVFPALAPSSTKSETIDLPPAPINGQLSIVFINDTTCIEWTELSNFQLDVTQLFKSVTTESYISDTLEYVYDLDLSIGFNYTINGKFYYRGALSDINGNSLSNWYRYEYPAFIYNSLSELIVKQYSNILETNIIDIDSSFWGIINNSGNLTAAMMITSNDTDVINSVEDKSFILGNSTLNLITNQSQSTLLDINPNNITTTLTTTYEDTNPARVFGQQRSNGQSTFNGALAAPLTANVLYRSGSTYYTDRNLANKFNGGSLYYKIQSQNLIQSNVNRINNVGRIIPI
jgi:hypothetical protein